MGQISSLVTEAYTTAIEKGWYEKPVSFGDEIALCHSELSESLQEYRMEGWKNKKKISIELADTIIRILSMSGAHDIDIEGAILEKMAFNKTRPYRSGGKVL